MKKVIGTLLLLVVFVLLAGPFAGGIRAEKELRQLVDRVDEYPGYSATWQTYDRGWFTTEAVLAVGLDSDFLAGTESGVKNVVLPLQVNLRHGPLLLQGTAGTGWFSWEVNLAHETVAWLEENVSQATQAPLYQARGHMALTGAVEFEDELQSLTFTDEDGSITLRSDGYAGQGSVDADRQLVYEGVLRNTDLTSQDALLALGTTTINTTGDLSRLDWDTFLYPSDFVVDVSSLHMEGHGNVTEMSELVVEGFVEMPQDENWFNLSATLSLARMQAPELQLNDVAMAFAYERISLTAYQAYMDTLAAMGPEAVPDYSQFFTPEIMQEFFANQPAFVLRDLSFSMPQGDFEGDFALSLKENFNVADQALNPMVLFQALTFDANAEIDRPLAVYFANQSSGAGKPEGAGAERPQQGEALVQTLVDQGILVEDGEDLKMALQFMDGQLLMNGNPMPFPLGMLLGGQQQGQQR